MASNRRLRVALVGFNFGKYSVRLASALARHAEVLLVLPDQVVGPHIANLNGAVKLVSFPRQRIRHDFNLEILPRIAAAFG